MGAPVSQMNSFGALYGGGAGGKSMGDDQRNQLLNQINATGGGFFKTQLDGSQPQGPQMGFGMDPSTGLPFGQDPMQQQNFGDSIQTPPMQQPQPQLPPAVGLPTQGMGGGKEMPGQILNQVAPQVGNTMNGGLNPPQQLPQGPQIGFGMPAQPAPMAQPANRIMPPSGGLNSPVRTQLPQQPAPIAQPINRFAPPNAAGVRSAPAANRYTRNRIR